MQVGFTTDVKKTLRQESCGFFSPCWPGINKNDIQIKQNKTHGWWMKSCETCRHKSYGTNLWKVVGIPGNAGFFAINNISFTPWYGRFATYWGESCSSPGQGSPWKHGLEKWSNTISSACSEIQHIKTWSSQLGYSNTSLPSGTMVLSSRYLHCDALLP